MPIIYNKGYSLPVATIPKFFLNTEIIPANGQGFETIDNYWLNQKSINSILQDSLGFLWIGTEDGNLWFIIMYFGLAKFDPTTKGCTLTLYPNQNSKGKTCIHNLLPEN